MKFGSLTVASALLTAPSVSAIGSLGFNLGSSRNYDGACRTPADFTNDMREMSSYTDTIRIYAVSDCNTLQNLAPALVQNNFKAFLGLWPSDDGHFGAELTALVTYLPSISIDNVEAFVVGSEALYRKDFTPEGLAARITTVKRFVANIRDKDGKSFSSVPVGFADSWNILVDGSSKPAIEASDIVLANAFSFWQGQTQANASYSFMDDIMQALQTVQSIKGPNAPFWVGETGWPTDGANFQVSAPSLENAARYWKHAVCAIRAWGVNILAFEAYDESWKPDTSGISNVEKHWGVLQDDGTPKYDLTCAF